MASDSISSPPYPSQLTSSDSLYRQLEELREWVLEVQEDLKYRIPEKYRERIESPPEVLPAQTVWTGISVCDKYWVLIYMRKVREGWDQLLRDHEDTWGSKLALKKQYSLLLSAIHVLADAFTSPELREMRNEKQMSDYTKKMKALEKHLNQMMTPEEYSTDDDSDEKPVEDEDNWGDESLT